MRTDVNLQVSGMQTSERQVSQEVTERFWINAGTKLEIWVEATPGDSISQHTENLPSIQLATGPAVPEGHSRCSLDRSSRV